MNEPTSGETLETTASTPSETKTVSDQPQTDTQSVFTEESLMAILAYIGPLVLVPLFTKRDNPQVMFHVRQGLVLFSIGAFLWVISRWFMIGFLWPAISLLNFALLVLSLIGISHVLTRKEKSLPLVGKFSEYFKV